LSTIVFIEKLEAIYFPPTQLDSTYTLLAKVGLGNVVYLTSHAIFNEFLFLVHIVFAILTKNDKLYCALHIFQIIYFCKDWIVLFLYYTCLFFDPDWQASVAETNTT
jgi:hypothetical protein